MAKASTLALDCSLMRPGERVCVAVSGGADSVALLLALQEANDSNRLKESLGIVLSAVHVHHGLRGAEADADEAFVRELCERLSVPVVVERVDVAARQSEEREGLEEAARELRYGVFWRLIEDGKADVVATAHTLDDQAETVVMKLLRGAWTEGIGGIAPEMERSGISDQRSAGKLNGRIVRPMLGVRRAEVESFLRERGQTWREDATNEDVSLTRNRVRHELMPRLREFNPGVDAALARLAEIARDEEAFWRAEVERVAPQVVLPGKPVRGGGRAVGTVTGNSSCAVEVERLRALAPALRRRVLRTAARSLGCRISADETAKLLALAGFAAHVHPAVGSKPGTRLELGGGLRAERTAREIQLRVENASFVARAGGR
ncbi:MAG TPA: tRNA lysidine(34) synthetase TilS [Candidatus Aquilonibacter sp.]|nr:tRNA lysidine(34) synthetase TilS [Candidatus Aquilonibacter sp.]